MGTPPKLKYLFQVEFTDGTKYFQNLEDTPTLNGTRNRNCYSDVLHLIEEEGKEILTFSLVGDNHYVSVNLQTGIFNVDGLDLLLESVKLPGLPDKFELVWYHQVTQDQNVDLKMSESLEWEEQGRSISEFREYFIGWRCMVAGKEYTQKLAVA